MRIDMMSKPQIFEEATSPEEHLESFPESTAPPCDSGQADHSMKRFGGNFRQLGWGDRLNLAFATILGLALVVALSPILLVSWLCLHLAKRGLGFKSSIGSKQS
jgi:hypothetical protein